MGEISADNLKKVSEACYQAAVQMNPESYASQRFYDFAYGTSLVVAGLIVCGMIFYFMWKES